MNNQYYAQLDEQFKERVYNILFDDPSNHDDNEALQLIQQLVTNGRTTILCTGNNQRGINRTV